MMLVVHPTGNPFVRALLAALSERQLLAEYITTLGFTPEDRWLRFLPRMVARQLRRRYYDVPQVRLQTRPLRETVRLLLGNAIPSLVRHESGWASIDAIMRDLDRSAADCVRRGKISLKSVYAYEDCALDVFRAAKERGISRYYDLPIGYWRMAQLVFYEEAELQPEWRATLDGLDDSSEKLARKEEELTLASHIIVASQFTKRTLEMFPRECMASIDVVPYGAPIAIDEPALDRRLASPNAILRVLFVGGLSQRKGLSYLFEAAEKLGRNIALTVVGRRPCKPCASLDRALQKHNYIETLPRTELLQLMTRHDVLVLPSLFEGFGLVLLEAMAQGLPVIATDHTAAPDLFHSGEAGIIVPIRSADAIAAALERLLQNPTERTAMSRRARAIAANASWQSYGDKVAAICCDDMRRIANAW